MPDHGGAGSGGSTPRRMSTRDATSSRSPGGARIPNRAGSARTGSTPGVAATRSSARAEAARSAARRRGPKRRVIDYPRRGKTGFRRWLPSWRLLLGSVLTIGALGFFAVVIAYATTTIPKPIDFAKKQTATIYYKDGKTPIGTFGIKRELVKIGDLPDYVGNAVVASEDRTFWKNSGVSLTGICLLYTSDAADELLCVDL